MTAQLAKSSLILALVPASFAGCSSKPALPILSDSAVVAAVAGCWELVDGPWRTNPSLGKVDPVVRVPQNGIRFVLERELVPGWDAMQQPNRLLYSVRTDSSTGRGLFTSWTREDGAEPRVYIGNPMPMAGFALSLSLKRDQLVGKLTAFTDAPASSWSSGEASAKVTARRVDCSPVHSAATPH